MKTIAFIKPNYGAGRIRRSLAAVQMLLAPLALVEFPALTASAQGGQHASGVFEIGAQAIGVATRESPAIDGRTLAEGYLTQPMIMAQLDPWSGLLSLKGTLDFEGATIKRGELNAGIYGEGYIDRRHPHTYSTRDGAHIGAKIWRGRHEWRVHYSWEGLCGLRYR